MMAHTGWPYGADFLHGLCALARAWCAGAQSSDHHRVFATLRANAKRRVRWDAEDEPSTVYASLPFGPRMRIDVPSAHARLQATALSDRLEAEVHRFVVEGARLPGLHALGLCPGVQLDLVGDGAPQGTFVLHNSDLHPDPTWPDTKHPLFFGFGQRRSMEDAAQAFLATVATIEANAPQPCDPFWVFAHPAGQYKERLDWCGGPIQARDEPAALAIAQVVLDKAVGKEGLQAFQRPRVDGVLALPRFDFVG
jgi:hypothetical protein